MFLHAMKKRDGAYPITRGHVTDAGVDVRIPQNSTIKINGVEIYPSPQGTWQINPEDNVLIPSGWVIEIPEGHMLTVCNRSSIAAKSGLIHGAHICDPGYSGEIFINLINVGNRTVDISVGDKIAQLVLIPFVTFSTSEVKTIEEVYVKETTRGSGGFGSTGA